MITVWYKGNQEGEKVGNALFKDTLTFLCVYMVKHQSGTCCRHFMEISFPISSKWSLICNIPQAQFYNLWSWNIPWLGWCLKYVFLNLVNKKQHFLFYFYCFCHTCIRVNEKADSAAKSVLDLPRFKVGVPYIDFKHHINQYILSTWQDDWNGAVVNKLHYVKPVLGDWQSSYRWSRKDEVVVCRARIGHTYLIHSYILKKDHPPRYEHCQCILTVRHILLM